MARTPVAGEVWEIRGTLGTHRRFGRQVHVATAILKQPSGRLIISVLARNPAFPGIRQARAKRLYEELGEGLYAALDAGDIKCLSSVIGNNLARVAIDGWRTMSAGSRAFAWLDRHGVPYSLAGRLMDVYGAELVEKLEDNPISAPRLSALVTGRPNRASGGGRRR
jgi:exodeoxyribonuclease V alpha subunit